MTAYVLHIGLDDGDIANMLSAGFVLTIDGGWESWSEAPGTDANDDTTMHVVMPLDNAGQARALLATLALGGITLHRMTTDTQRGIYAVVTDADDYGRYGGLECVWNIAD